MKLCKDCKHYCNASRCSYHNKTYTNPILGGTSPVYDDCINMRNGTAYWWRWNNCGHNAMHYEEAKRNEDKNNQD